jgi:hypothetical protein
MVSVNTPANVQSVPLTPAPDTVSSHDRPTSPQLAVDQARL